MAAVKERNETEQTNINNDDSISAAKGKKGNKKNKDEKKSKKGLIFFFLFLLVLGGIVAAIVLNVGNIRNGYIIPALRSIPVVKNIIPEDTTSSKANQSNGELLQENKQLKEDNDLKDSVIKELNSRIESQNGEISRLREIENQHIEFRREKNEFDRLIATNSPIDYKTYYETILPENAAQLYKEVVQSTQNNQELKDYTAKFESMKAKNAAAIMEEMIATDMDLVVLILDNIDSDQSSLILAAMDPANAASVAKQLSPD